MEAGQHGHRLGPHVVGQRVVIRRVLPGERGPSGGPAMTDILGVCERWDGVEVAVRRADGAVSVIPIGDIVTGKPVPPRPAIRHRVSAREAETHTAALFPGLHVEPLGGWLLRLHPDPALAHVKRPNSLLAVGDPGGDVAELARRALETYAAAGRRPLAHVEVASAGEQALRQLGWESLGPETYAFQLASVAHLRRDLTALDPAHEVVLAPGEVALGEVAGEVTEEATTLTATVGGALGVIGRGRAAISGDWIGLHALEVDPAHRRRGVGRALVAALVGWGAECGARTAWLHVAEDNLSALRAYDSYGFSTHHVMRYLTLPGRPSS
ncbi:MAG: GNAT family N-acetyltransferase [Nocardioides sp.]